MIVSCRPNSVKHHYTDRKSAQLFKITCYTSNMEYINNYIKGE